MHLFETLRTSVRSLLSNKTRSALTMLGVVIGTAAVIAMADRRLRRLPRAGLRILGLRGRLLRLLPRVESLDAAPDGSAGAGVGVRTHKERVLRLPFEEKGALLSITATGFFHVEVCEWNEFETMGVAALMPDVFKEKSSGVPQSMFLFSATTYEGRPFTSSSSWARYSPTSPSIMRMTPLKKRLTAIREAHPCTALFVKSFS